jgi:hypothetical protein
MRTTTRRQFLRGVGGVVLPLPFLPSVARATAVPSRDPHPLVVFRVANGVAQALNFDGVQESDKFWPSRAGALSTEGLGEDVGQSTSVLAPYASRLMMVNGAYAPFPPQAELHAAGGNQLLTAMPPGPPTHTVMTYAQGESIDNYVARMNPDVNRGEPLTLFTGRRSGFGSEILSYRGPNDLRSAEDDPWSVYVRLTGGEVSVGERRSVNDHVLEQLRALMSSSQLGEADRKRLEQHTESIWDFETLCGRLAAEAEVGMEELSGLSRLDDYRLTFARLHADVIALALSCDLARAATLQIGDRTDLTQYTIRGEKLATYHSISHRQAEDDAVRHAAIDRLHLEAFRYLLDQLASRDVLDRSVVCFVSELGHGVTHTYHRQPWVIAGRGDGTLRTGVYLELPEFTHNQLLNTLITATGLRTPEGGAITDFGDPSLEQTLCDAMVAVPV